MKNISILFVDDEQHILNALKRNLIKETFRKHFAISGQKALEIMAKEQIQVIVSDMKMPEMDGLTLLHKVKEKYPETIRLVLSGFTQIAQIIPAINTGEIFRYVTKPIDPDEFKKTLQEAINFYLLNRDRQELVEKLQQQNEELQRAYDQTRKYAEDLTAEIEERKKAEKKIRGLARFPSENPNPVIRVNNDCIVIYANNASELLLHQWGISRGDIMPVNICQIIADVKSSGKAQNLELTCDNKELSINFAPVTNETFINIYGFDITKRKRAEEELASARESEIRIESRIEKTLLRGYPPILFKKASVSAITLPSAHLDGDFYEIVDYQPDCFDVLIGDVMGKGVHAALMGAGVKQFILKSLCRDRSPDSADGLPDLLNLFSELQHEVTPKLIELEHFITLCYARVDLNKMQLRFVDCGHNPILHYSAATDQCFRLKGDNMPIGFVAEEEYQVHSTKLAPGDVLFFFSDGITEAANHEGDMFGEQRLVDFICSHAEMESFTLINSLRQTVEKFSGTNKFKDDFTCVSIRIDSQPEKSIELAGDLGELGRAREFTRDFCLQLPGKSLDQKKIFQLELAVNEVIVNIIEHSYKRSPGKKIKLKAHVAAESLVFEIFDQGVQFKPKDITRPEPDQEHGRGLFLIHESVDHVSYSHENGNNCCRLEINT